MCVNMEGGRIPTFLFYGRLSVKHVLCASCFSGALKDGARPWLSYHVCLWLSFYKEGLTLARELHGSHQLPPTGKCPTPILLSSRYLMSQSNNAIAKWLKGGAKGIISALLQVLEKQTNFFRKPLCSRIKGISSQVCWRRPVIPALRRQIVSSRQTWGRKTSDNLDSVSKYRNLEIPKGMLLSFSVWLLVAGSALVLKYVKD